jgi:hypothetical protein
MAQVPSHLNASEALGAQQIAAVAVYHRGSYWASVRRQQGSMIARIALGRRPDPDPAQTPDLLGSYTAARPGGPRVRILTAGTLLAVTSEELALVAIRLHGASLTAGQVMLRMPRGEVKTAQLGGGWHGVFNTAPIPLTIVLVNGDTWRLEVFRIDLRRAKAVVEALTA